MVPSSAITVAASGERLLCGGFFLGETICLGKFDFIADYFRGLSLFRRRGDSVIAFMVSTHRGGGGVGGFIPTVGHDRGLHRGVCHAVERRQGLRPPFSQEVRHRGFARSCHNHTMDGECSGRSGHNDGSPVDSGAVAGNG
jgi:hypothetical protein